MNLLIKMYCKQNVKYQQDAQLSQSAMRRVSWNLANCHATVQYDKSWTNRSYEVGGLKWADV